MWQWYTSTIKASPLIAAFIQFAILGMVGEWVSAKVKRVPMGLGPVTFLGKMLAWGILGFIIKLAFKSFDGFAEHLIQVFRPDLNMKILMSTTGGLICWAFIKSVSINIFFAPQMMFFHRWEDNLVLRRNSYVGMGFALKSILWFWIPAHTITFSIPIPDVQITLAAIWGVMLGLILGLAMRRNVAAPVGAPKAPESAKARS